MNVDFKLLKRQRATLIKLIDNEKNEKIQNHLIGILNLLDTIQDEEEDKDKAPTKKKQLTKT